MSLAVDVCKGVGDEGYVAARYASASSRVAETSGVDVNLGVDSVFDVLAAALSPASFSTDATAALNAALWQLER